MNVTNMRKFIEALRRTQHTQVRSTLGAYDHYCAVGIGIVDGMGLDLMNMYRVTNYSSERAYEVICKWLDIPLGLPQRGPAVMEGSLWEIMMMNDVNKWSFDHIADVLESRLPVQAPAVRALEVERELARLEG